ncbi:VC0807 family protein [Catenulispora pinisilvae]|uniref:VC0807 family protein n=1 Tax=Catenulispora pinisilvae TaxID=2705253 RepID=UPI001891B603|nr:VC0807 family protein [Catenulispora pinisilvae]
MSAQEAAPTSRGRAALALVWDVGAPIGMYYLLHGLGLSTFLALLLSAVLPGLTSVYQVVRSRKLDGLSLFMVSITVLSALASLISGSPRFLLAKDGYLTAFAGAWLLITARSERPVVFMFARALLEGRVGPHGESWDVLWERLPGFRRIWRVAAVIWGTATIADAVVRFAMAYTLPVNQVPALNGVQWGVLFILLQVVTNVYYHRAGLYDPRSALYEPLFDRAPILAEPTTARQSAELQ